MIVRNRGLKLKLLTDTLLETMKLTALIFSIVVGGLIFARFLALSGVSQIIQDFLTQNGFLGASVLMLCTMLLFPEIATYLPDLMK